LAGGEGNDFYGIEYDYGDTPTVITDYEADEEIVLFLPVAFEGTEVDITPNETGEDMLVNFGIHTAIVLQGVTDPDTVNLSVQLDWGSLEQGEESDLLVGTVVADDLSSGPDSDIIIAGRGDDAVDAGGANDFIRGDNGDDSLYGNSGQDTIFGGFGDDLIRGGAGADTIIDSRGADSVRGGTGNDFIQVADFDIANDEAPDQVSAGEGNDFVFVDDGDDVRLGAGNDFAIVDLVDVNADPVIFRDFSPDEDILEILVFETGGEGVLAVTPIGEDTSVTVDGQEVAILSGITLTTQDIAPDGFIFATVIQPDV
jgi:Ca2+-binding RTX toxin-like protein